ncbi:MAG: hypothetical protein HZB10_00540 [Candidatus Yonathbacteria bacterium]|nr:hypothetical protein [Candidatus Yonathbacteria bacterium]
MKILTPIEKLFTPSILIALNLAIILAAEFMGGGTYFAETGLMHAIAIVFVGLIILQIFTDYAFSDRILKGFLRVQLGFFLFLGLVHFYEYLGLHILMLDSEIVEISVAISYLMWFLGMLLALEFVSRIYYQRSGFVMKILVALISFVALVLIALHVVPDATVYLPVWFPEMVLFVIVVLAFAEISSLVKMRKIMPVFEGYSNYAIPAMTILFLAAFSEYAESTGILNLIGLSDVQNLYISHFLIYAVLSLLLIGFGKLKRPKGIYADM